MLQTPCINYYPYYVILCRKWSEIPGDNPQNEPRGSETRFKMEKGTGRVIDVVHPAYLKLILDKRNRSFSQASILGKIIELVCEAIVLELVSVSNEWWRKSRTCVTRVIKSRA